MTQKIDNLNTEKNDETLVLEEIDSNAMPTQSKEETNIDEIDSKAIPKQPKEEKSVDEYGRVILEPTFENILTMSKNQVKMNYSGIKNAINQYKAISSEFVKDTELFSKGKNNLCLVKINGEQLLLYCDLPKESIDKKVYPHRIIKNEEYKDYPILLTITTPISLRRGKEIVDLVMFTKNIKKANVAPRKAYAEKYRINKNAVLKGLEGVAPVAGLYDKKEYKDIQGEIAAAIIREKIGETPKTNMSSREKLATQRQTAKTIKAAIALDEPIVYFYDVVADKENNPAFVNMQQVLNDKFLGKLVPQHYFAVAEGSDRIEKFNFLALDAIVKDCDSKQDKDFALNISCRLLMKQNILKKLLTKSKTENENLILSFDCTLLESLGDSGIKAITALKEAGIKIMLDNTEQAGMKVLTEYFIDYIRFDSRYYDETNPKAVCHLDMMTGYAKVQGITTVAMYTENTKQALNMIAHGVDCIQGNAVSTPRRLFNIALREKKMLPVSGG